MKTYLECIPCFFRQALEAAKLAGADKKTQKKILDEVSKKIPAFSLKLTPPEIARTVYGVVQKHTGGIDAYVKIKQKSNRMSLELYPDLKQIIDSSETPFLNAVRLAVAGNVIDYGVPFAFDIEREIEECLEKEFAVFDYKELEKGIEKAKLVLYILDNAGEIVFDKILIEEIKTEVVAVVREKPIINDVTMQDAKEINLSDVCKVISSGSDIPGTILQEATKDFRSIYDKADLIISKGQGNYETLSDEKKDIYFIFKAKCPVVAEHVGCNLGDIILKKQ